MYEFVHYSLVLVLLFVRTEMECGSLVTNGNDRRHRSSGQRNKNDWQKEDNNRKRQNVGLVSLHHVINNDTISVS